MQAAATIQPIGEVSSIKRERTLQKKTLTPHEVAELCGFGITATYKMLHDGMIPHIRVGNRFYIPRVALMRWLESFGSTARQ